MASVKQGAREIDFKPKPGSFLVSFNLDDAELPELVKAISNITGRRFIYGGKLRSIKATVYSPEKVTAAEAYSAFLSILETNGMTVIPHGRFLKIIESPGVVTDTTQIFGPASPVPDEDRYVTRLYRLAHIDAAEASTVLTKFKTKDGDITVYGPSNLLIITETGSNLQRMLRILEEVDVGGAGEQLWVEPINYGSAAEMATKLNDIFDLKSKGSSKTGAAAPSSPGSSPSPSGGGGGGATSRIIADERGNSLIIIATEPDYLRMLELIKRLDVKQSGEGEIHVLPLQYAACKDLSQTLNAILGTSAARPGGGAVPGGTGALPGGAAAGAGARPGGATGVGALADEVFEGRIRVTCDEATNSLVTTSSLRDYAQLRSVIEKLDMPRRQVFIEAVIMDVEVKRETDIGVAYHGGAPQGFGSLGQGFIYGGNNAAQSISGVPDNLEGLAFGVLGPQIPNTSGLLGTGLSIPALGIVLDAVATDGDTNVLATPHILATDNISAEISVGANIPLQTNVGGGLGSLAGLAGGAGATGAAGLLGGGLLGGGFNAQRQDVGTKIKIIPHVNASDEVRLELNEEISDPGAAQGALGAVPINKRTANTTLIVRDQQTVVIGGLMKDEVDNSASKIPVLGDIPVLGVLFRSTKKTKVKSNLLLILTPYVIRGQEDLRNIFERKMQERQEYLDRYFVFSDSAPWEPPRDFSRANGLVEDIRQQILAQEEKVRVELESKPKARRTHEPVAPIPLPSMGGAKPVGVGGGGGGGEEPGGGAGKPRIRLPSSPASPPPPPGGQRVE
jgi:general secretion pathway protein D